MYAVGIEVGHGLNLGLINLRTGSKELGRGGQSREKSGELIKAKGGEGGRDSVVSSASDRQKMLPGYGTLESLETLNMSSFHGLWRQSPRSHAL